MNDRTLEIDGIFYFQTFATRLPDKPGDAPLNRGRAFERPRGAFLGG